MRVSESIKIRAPSIVIWDAVSDPDQWPSFVSKISEVEKLEDGFYRILINNKEVIGKIASSEQCRRLLFAGQLVNQPGNSEFLIEYLLQDKSSHVVVTEIQQFHLPFPISLLVKFLFKFGKSQGPTNLQLLKELCEKKQ